LDALEGRPAVDKIRAEAKRRLANYLVKRKSETAVRRQCDGPHFGAPGQIRSSRRPKCNYAAVAFTACGGKLK